MNIFVTHSDPERAATHQHDQHLRKMILETAQIIDGGTRPYMRDRFGPGDYEIVKIPHSHRDNPVILSAGDRFVAEWCLRHLRALLGEFVFRWGHTHAYAEKAVYGALCGRLDVIRDHLPRRAGFRLAMPDSVRCDAPLYTRDMNLLVPTYRRYYVRHKMRYGKRNLPCTWTRRSRPEWCPLPETSHG